MFEAASKTERVSDRIIEQIRDAILSGRLKPGDRLASEKELVAQFGVSKATMREALRVLEAMGLVEIRKGTQGGVFVAEVDMKTTVHSIMNFLHFKAVSVRDITMLRFMIEPSVAHLAALVRSGEDIVRLQEMVEADPGDRGGAAGKEIGFHRYLARMTGNPILILIMDFLDNLLRDLKEQLDLGPDFYAQVKESHRRILDCMIAEDCVGARREMAADLLAVGDYMAQATGSPPFDPAMLGFSRAALYLGGDNGDSPLESPQRMSTALLKALLGEGVDPEIVKRGMVVKQVASGDLYVIVPRERKESE
jgi:GntR family transcriptional repressor for pyruvate dehydrogenase complex